MKPTDEQEQAALERRWGKRTESAQADSVQRGVVPPNVQLDEILKPILAHADSIEAKDPKTATEIRQTAKRLRWHMDVLMIEAKRHNNRI